MKSIKAIDSKVISTLSLEYMLQVIFNEIVEQRQNKSQILPS